MSKVRIRIRGPQGVHALDLLSSTTVLELDADIKSKSGLDGALDLRIGYPPKPLDLTIYDPSSTLESLPFKLNGEQIIVAQSSNFEASPPKAAAQSSKDSSASLAKNVKDETPPLDPNSSFSLNAAINSTSNASSANNTSGKSTNMRNLRTSKKDDLDVEPPVIQVSTHPGQSLVLRIMEDDNSCLFRAINYVFMRSIDTMQELRSLVAQTIQDDATLPPAEQQYGDAMLGMSRDNYCQKIQRPDVWGGGIELAILSKYIDLELWSIDVSTGRLDCFNQGKPNCGIVIYSGIHYDCLAMTSTPWSSDEDVTIFSSGDKGILEAANKLVNVLRGRHYYTDTSKFSLKCNICDQGLVGEREAMEHAQTTGHTNFGEY